jgi:hypothetical protein
LIAVNGSADYQRGFVEGWNACQGDASELMDLSESSLQPMQVKAPASKPKRKASAYSKRYGKMFQRVAPKYKLKNGSWAKDGFKRAQAAAHKLTKK